MSDLLSDKHLRRYALAQRISLDKHLEKLRKSSALSNGFRNDLIAGAVMSSQIEGSRVTLASFQSALSKGGRKPRDVKEVQDLVDAYAFARSHKLLHANAMVAHGLLSATLLREHPESIGAVRSKGVSVIELQSGQVRYQAPETRLAKQLAKRLFDEASALLKEELDATEAFHYAALLHLRIAQVHPFADGNGRLARLAEKWFLAEALGEHLWRLNSEAFYRMNMQLYYSRIALGAVYDEASAAEPTGFLLLLPRALKHR